MDLDRDGATSALNAIVEHELAGAVRYTQYSLMVFGHARIPITGWMREHATEALMHAGLVGEEVTTLGANVSLAIGGSWERITRPSTTSWRNCSSMSATGYSSTGSSSPWSRDAAWPSRSSPGR